MERTLLSIAIFLISATIMAQERTVLTEDEFLSALSTQHPAAVARSGDLGTAEAKRLQAGLLNNPTLDFLQEQPDDIPRETVWSVSWTPPLDGRRRWSVRESEAAVGAERAVLKSGLNSLRLEQRRDFAAWAGGHTRAEILREHVRRLEGLAERMRRRADAGEESLLDARRLEIASETSKAALSEATAIETQARVAATAWLLVDANHLTESSPAARPEMPALPEAPTGVDLSLQPDLAAASYRVEQAEASERLSKRGIAAPELLLGWKTIDGSLIDTDGPVFGLSWAVPVFDRRQSDRLGAEKSLEAAHARSEWLSQRVKSELVAAQASYKELRQSALATEDSLVGLGDVAGAATASYEHGESSVTDLLDTLRAVLDSRLAALDLYVAALEAHRELEVATGRTLTSGGVS